MKIAITGHTAGIGLGLKEIYEKNGHEVIGFSRETGYDISKKEDRERIIKESESCDMFFNNAFDWDNPFAQYELLDELWNKWLGQKKTIVNMSSSTTSRFNKHKDVPSTYRTVKRAIDDHVDFLRNQSLWPYLSTISPCRVKGRRNKLTATASNVLTPEQFCEIVYNVLSQPYCRINELKLELHPLELFGD